MTEGPLGGPRPLARKEVTIVFSKQVQQRERLKNLVSSISDSSRIRIDVNDVELSITEGSTAAHIMVGDDKLLLEDLNQLKSDINDAKAASDVRVGNILAIEIE